MTNAYASTNLLAALPDGNLSLDPTPIAYEDDADTLWHFLFDEVDGACASSVNGYSLAEGGYGLNAGAPGKIGRARQIANTAWLAGGVGSLSLTEYTFGFWVYVTSALPTGEGQQFFFWTLNQQTTFSILVSSGVRRLRFVAGWPPVFEPACPTFAQNQWHHIMMRRVGSAWTLRLDGVTLASVTDSRSDLGSGPQNLRVGQDNIGGGDTRWDGLIDELFCTSRGLSDEEMDVLYSGSAKASARWKTAIRDGRLDELASIETDSFAFVVDLGSAQAVDVVALLNHSLAMDEATVTIQAADDITFTTNLVTPKAATALTSGRGPQVKDSALTFASTTKRFWRAVLTFSGAREVRVGELFVGLTTALTRRLVEARRDRERVESLVFQSDAGDELRWFRQGPVRSIELALRDLSEAHADELVALCEASVGGEVPILFCERRTTGSAASSDDEQRCVFGRLSESVAMELVDHGSEGELYQPAELVLESLVREAGS